MFDQLKKRGLDLVFLALAGGLGIGGLYVYSSIQAHKALDAAIIEIIQQSNSAAQEAPVQKEAPVTP